jgi:preprotein translocase subunit SecA
MYCHCAWSTSRSPVQGRQDRHRHSEGCMQRLAHRGEKHLDAKRTQPDCERMRKLVRSLETNDVDEALAHQVAAWTLIRPASSTLTQNHRRPTCNCNNIRYASTQAKNADIDQHLLLVTSPSRSPCPRFSPRDVAFE